MEGNLCHTKAITIGANLTSALSLTGANGQAIKCNYFEFSVSDIVTVLGTNVGVVTVTASDVSQYQGTNPSLGNGASGTFGNTFSTERPYIWYLGFGRRTSAIKITNSSPVSKTVICNYGINVTMNPIDKGFSPQI